MYTFWSLDHNYQQPCISRRQAIARKRNKAERKASTSTSWGYSAICSFKKKTQSTRTIVRGYVLLSLSWVGWLMRMESSIDRKRVEQKNNCWWWRKCELGSGNRVGSLLSLSGSDYWIISQASRNRSKNCKVQRLCRCRRKVSASDLVLILLRRRLHYISCKLFPTTRGFLLEKLIILLCSIWSIFWKFRQKDLIFVTKLLPQSKITAEFARFHVDINQEAGRSTTARYIISTTSCFGHGLTFSEAISVGMLEPDFRASTMAQVWCRHYRQGNKKSNVYTWLFVCKDSKTEERILEVNKLREGITAAASRAALSSVMELKDTARDEVPVDLNDAIIDDSY